MTRSGITLVTAFKPFQGRGKNGSATLLSWLRRRLNAQHFPTAILSVDWEIAPKRLRRLIQRFRPKRCLALGEGRAGQVAFELQAWNRLEGTDESGNARIPQPIMIAAPDRVPASFPLPEHLPTHLLPPGVEFQTSSDAGKFLCNRVLWEGLQTTCPKVGFLHLPPQSDTSDADYRAALGPFVLALLVTKNPKEGGRGTSI